MADSLDDNPEEEFSGVFTDIFPAEWAADPDFCQYLTQLRNVFWLVEARPTLRPSEDDLARP